MVGCLSLAPYITQGQGSTYDLLAPLPGGTQQLDAKTGFLQYAKQMFPFLLSIAAILAVVMIVVGGIQYVASAGNTSLLGDAKDRIYNAMLGLLLALTAWLILYTINPDLLTLRIDVAPVGTDGSNRNPPRDNPDPPPLPTPPPSSTSGPTPPPTTTSGPPIPTPPPGP